ncbi:hypothetical protein PG997_006143 [Apiospora hydei]|uniref:Uncharacterized protein n=1 Tax=Apiospora hydei TaxID=1337664 RepID=A0ABR1WMX1_9PEZI
MTSSSRADTAQLGAVDHTIQHEATDAEPSEQDSDASTQHQTFSYGSTTSSRSSFSAMGRLAQNMKPKPPAEKDIQALKSFDVALDQKILDRFTLVHDCIEGPLLKHISKSGAKKCSMSIRLMVLGSSQEVAKPYIVVLASQDQCKRVQNFEFLAYGRPPEKKGDEAEIEVLAPLGDNDPSILPFTYCGTPITVRHQSGYEARATLGGILRVDYENGEFQLYGLTAGHVIEGSGGENSSSSIDHEDGSSGEPWSDSDSGSDSDTETDCSSNLFMNADILATSKPVEQLPCQEPCTDPWYSPWSWRLGTIKTPSAKTSNESKNQLIDGPNRNLDWALIELDSYAPNLLPSMSKTGDVLSLELKPPSFCTDHDKKGHGVRALMISGSEGPKAGFISALPSRLLLSPGTGFVDAMIINLDECQGLFGPDSSLFSKIYTDAHKDVVDGDSGSWVVDEYSLEVYGHIVAADAFGGGYLIPIQDTMSDIQRNLKVASVSLPSTTCIGTKNASKDPHPLGWFLKLTSQDLYKEKDPQI